MSNLASLLLITTRESIAVDVRYINDNAYNERE